MFESTIAIEGRDIATCTARTAVAARKAAGKHLYATHNEGRWFVQGDEAEGVLTLIQRATERTATIRTVEADHDRAVTVEVAPEPVAIEAPAEEAPAAPSHRVLSPSRVSRTLGEQFHRSQGRTGTGFKVMADDQSVTVYHVGDARGEALPRYAEALRTAGYVVVDGEVGEDGEVYTLDVTLAA